MKMPTFSTIRTTIHKLAWLANTMTKIIEGINILTQVTEKIIKKDEHGKTMNNIMKQLTKYPNKIQKYKRTDLDA